MCASARRCSWRRARRPAHPQPEDGASHDHHHLGPEIRNTVCQYRAAPAGFGFGLGVAVRVSEGLSSVPAIPANSPGTALTARSFSAIQGALVVVVGTAAPGELRKYYREQVQDIVYGAMTR